MQVQIDAVHGLPAAVIPGYADAYDIDRAVGADGGRCNDALARGDSAAPAGRAVRLERHELALFVRDVDGAVGRHHRSRARRNGADINDRLDRVVRGLGDDIDEAGVVGRTVRGFPAPGVARQQRCQQAGAERSTDDPVVNP